MKITDISEINQVDDLVDIILHAEFTREEKRDLGLISPTVFVTMSRLGSSITFCDGGLPVPCMFSAEEKAEVLAFSRNRKITN